MFTPRTTGRDLGIRISEFGFLRLPEIRNPISEFRNPSRCSPQYVTNKNQNAENHDKGIVLRITGLNETDRPAECLDEAADKSHRAVNDPSIPPTRAVCAPLGQSRRTIHQTVDNVGIKSPQRFSRTFRPIYEKSVVQLIDVVLVQQDRIGRSILPNL